ncbi:MAG: complex I NDUFA9 subunit family protein [Candidatus Puniceispirillum sp.]|nr:complex I NDUFA9 subunit family protein [Candidatus Puniceispirillum sp.]MBL6774438.1 complex I NDUFA9 subunit family protein [Candidatus Puniceispirillum sp.]
MINTVAVIGGSGFVGRATVERLARAGKQIIVLCRNSERAKYLKPLGNVGQITLLAGNATDQTVLETVIKSADAVVNLVGILAEGGGQKFATLQADLPGRIGALAKANGVGSVVHVSAIGADPNSLSHYAQSKAAGEANLLSAFPAAVVLRPSIIFGPRDDFFNRFAAMAMMAPALPLPGGGKMQMQPVYVEDVVGAIIGSLGLADKLAKPAEGKIYELGGPETYSFRRLMEITLRQIGRRRLLVPVPFLALSCGAVLAGLLPNPPITRDQVRLLKCDNVVANKARTLVDLGVTATSVDVVLPTYLDRYRPGGMFRS